MKKKMWIIAAAIVLLCLLIISAINAAHTPDTTVVNMTYGDSHGNLIQYYLCQGPDESRIWSVIDPAEANIVRQCTIGSFPAVLYEKGEFRYLCWSVSPILSCVLEYDPDVQSEEDIFRMAQSVPAP